MNTTIFDIETGGLPEAELLRIIEPFDPGAVKVGNITDLDKVAAKIEREQEKYYADACNNAAKSALTGRVLAIGVKPLDGEAIIIGDANEADLLSKFWKRFVSTSGRWVGFNIMLFDLPFLCQRSWVHNLSVPSIREGRNWSSVPSIREGRHWSDAFLDLRETWQLGNRQLAGSLDSIAKAFGLSGKTVSGAEFAKLWGNPNMRGQAEDYLRKDLELTEALYLRMQ